MDKVSSMQLLLDKMHSKFDEALHLAVFSVPTTDSNAEISAFSMKIKEQVTSIVNTYEEIDELADQLPGKDKTMEDQIEEIRLLKEEDEKISEELKESLQLAEEWRNKSRSFLQCVTKDLLSKD